MINYRLILLTSFALMGFVIVSSTLSCDLHDLHMLNRAGAMLAAFAALGVLFQVRKEEQYAEEDKSDEDFSADVEMDSITRTMAERAYKFRSADRHGRRRLIVAQIALVLFVAELMHGWGDFALGAICVSGAVQEHS